LSSRQHQKKIITDIEVGENKISSALEMAEAFNCHFANIEHDLAKDILLYQPQDYFSEHTPHQILLSLQGSLEPLLNI